MGNSQSDSSSDRVKYIKAKKVIESARNLKDEPLSDITNQLEQIFGIDHIPVSHRAQASLSPRRQQVGEGSVMKEFGRHLRDREYQERISNLESQLYYLKSVIEEMKDKSREDSPIQSEVQGNEVRQEQPSQLREVNQSRSRVSLTYFQTEPDDLLEGRQEESRLSNPLNAPRY